MSLSRIVKFAGVQLVSRLPSVSHRPLSGALGDIAHYIDGYGPFKGYMHRTVARALCISVEEAIPIVRSNFRHMAYTLLELASSSHIGNSVTTLMKIEGKEHYENCRRGGRGVILLSAHIGNFELLIQSLPLFDIPLTSIVWKQPDNDESRYLDNLRRQYGTRLLYSQDVATPDILRLLARGETILIVADHYNLARNTVSFFGFDTPMAAGPIHYSLKASAPIIPIRITRSASTHSIKIEPQLELPKTGDIYSNGLRMLVHVYERWIKENPEQYLWILRRHEWGSP